MNNKCLDYLSHKKEESFNEILFSYIDEKGVKDSDIYKRVDIDRKLFSKIRCNLDYIPKKNNIIKLCFALRLNKYDFNRLLNSAGYSLTNTRFDYIITYCLENHIYELSTINEHLYTYANAVL